MRPPTRSDCAVCWMYSSSAPTLASPEEVPDEDRQPGQSVALRVDDPQREHRERERPQEERHGQPAVVIVEQGLDVRGENWPIATCTATSVRLSTTLASVKTGCAICWRTVCAALGL